MANKIQVIIEGKDNVSAIIGDVEYKFTSGMEKMSKKAESFTGVLSSTKAKILGWAAAIYGAYKTIEKGMKVVEAGFREYQIETGFKKLAESYNIYGDQIIKKLEEVSNKTVDNSELMQQASKSMVIGLSESQIVSLMAVARAGARQTGDTVAEAYGKITDAIASGRTVQLKYMGLVVDSAAEEQKLADQLKIKVKYLSDEEKAYALANAVISKGNDLIVKMNANQEDELEKISQMKVAWKGATDELSKLLSLVYGKSGLNQTLTGLANLTTERAQWWQWFIEQTSKKMKNEPTISFDEYSKKIVRGKIIPEGEDTTKKHQKTAQEIEDEKNAYEKAKAERIAMAEELTDQIKELTSSELEYKLWALDQEIIARTKAANGEKNLLDQIGEYQKAKTKSIYLDVTGKPMGEISAMSEFDQKALEDIIRAHDERLRLQKDLTDKINQLTLSGSDYRLWKLQQEMAELESIFGTENQVIKDYYDATLIDISKSMDKTFSEEMKDAVIGWASNFSGELTDLVWDADASFKDIATSFGKMLTQMVIQKQIVDPMLEWGSNASNWKAAFSAIGSWFSGGGSATASARGNVFRGPGISAYENKIIGHPTLFPFAKGIGLMGEDGDEAIMPLGRTKSGKLGVKVADSAIPNMNFYITGNNVYDQASMEALVTRISTAVSRQVAPQAVAQNYKKDGTIRGLIRSAS